MTVVRLEDFQAELLRACETLNLDDPENNIFGQEVFDAGILEDELPERCLNDQHFMHGYKYARK